jgi:8-hydroxy-5-deazaflavin:NADPH oxidoreductase
MRIAVVGKGNVGGGLENAAAQESFLGLVFAINQGGLGPFVYRMAPPEQL